MDIRQADFNHPQVLALLQLHLDGMYATSPPDNVFALDLSGLQSDDVDVFSAWVDDGRQLVAMGAVKQHGDRTVEIKSMRTAPEHLGKGYGAALLSFLIEHARQGGADKISLETGSGPAFEAAIQLYRKFGFEQGEAFADYQPSAFSQFFHLTLDNEEQQQERTMTDSYVVSDDKTQLDVNVIHGFLQQSYWAKDIPIDTVQRSIANAMCFGVYTQTGNQVGFARVITDKATFAYLGDVFILPAHRGKGLSKKMMQFVMSHPDLQGLRRFMLATQDAHSLYSQYGFASPDDTASLMEIRKPNIYSAKLLGE